jgi:hypothetical protein
MAKSAILPALILVALVALLIREDTVDSDIKALRSQLYSLEGDIRTVKLKQDNLRNLEESDRSRLNARDRSDLDRGIAFCKTIPQADSCKGLMALVKIGRSAGVYLRGRRRSRRRDLEHFRGSGLGGPTKKIFSFQGTSGRSSFTGTA